MDWTAVAGVIVPTVLALLALWLRRRDRKHAKVAAVAAEARADRTEVLAQQATEEAHRASDALERIAPVLPRPAWTLEHSEGDIYALTYQGARAVHDVRVDTGDLGGKAVPADRLDPPLLDPGDPIRFYASVDFDTSNDRVTVTWAAEPGGVERQTWNRPLPPNANRSSHGH